MRLPRRNTLTAALAVGLLGLPAPGALAAPAAPGLAAVPDLAALQAEVEAAVARTDALSRELEQAAAQDGGLRVALERLTDEHDRAQAQLDARVRQVWITRGPDPTRWSHDLASPALRRIAQRGAEAAVRIDRDLVDAVAAHSDRSRSLRMQAVALRAALGDRAAQALAAQDQARTLLSEAEAIVRAQEQAQLAAAAHARDTAAQRERDRLAAASARLAAVRSSLDAASATVTVALTPPQSRRSRNAQLREAPVLALVESAGSGYPQGFAPTGQVLRGLASWYGPGFVGSPTASGTPYDPERLTCAHKSLPLGTVLRVSANGRAVSCLVNDRGPYVGPRILDLSRAGSRALGYEGVQAVVAEVLAPQ